MGGGSKALLCPYMKSTLLPGCKALCPAKTLCRFGRTCKTASVRTLIRQVYTPQLKSRDPKEDSTQYKSPNPKEGRGRRRGAESRQRGCGGSGGKACKRQVSGK